MKKQAPAACGRPRLYSERNVPWAVATYTVMIWSTRKPVLIHSAIRHYAKPQTKQVEITRPPGYVIRGNPRGAPAFEVRPWVISALSARAALDGPDCVHGRRPLSLDRALVLTIVPTNTNHPQS